MLVLIDVLVDGVNLVQVNAKEIDDTRKLIW